MPKSPVVVGQRVGRLTVLERGGQSKWRAYRWLCKCDCGKTLEVLGQQLTAQRTKSCGCLPTGPKPLDRQEAVLNQLRATYVHSAKARGISWSLSREEYVALFHGTCHYCGCSPTQIRSGYGSQHTHAGELIYNGIDRIDSGKGYVPENVVSCCGTCNRAKNDMSQRDFYSWAVRVVEYSQLGHLVD